MQVRQSVKTEIEQIISKYPNANPDQLGQIEAAENAIMAHTDARWWIDNRSNTARQPLKYGTTTAQKRNLAQ